LCRLLPLPWANSTRPRASAGTSSWPSRVASSVITATSRDWWLVRGLAVGTFGSSAIGLEQAADLFVAGLIELAVPEPDAIEGLGLGEADQPIDEPGQQRAAAGRADRDRGDDLERVALAQADRGGPHRRSGREPVVDDDRGAARDRGRLAVASKQPLASLELALLASGDPLD